MRGREVPLVLLALVLCLVSRGSAAPVTAGRATALAKMYTRGNHWAVGHLMGKKRADSPQLQEEESLKEQLREYVQWEEATKTLLSLLQAKAAQGHQPPPQEPLSFHQPAWDSEDVSNFKDAGSRLRGTVNIPGRWRSGEVGWDGSGRRVGKLEGGEVFARGRTKLLLTAAPAG
ncbi:hypothetical protein G4228_016872 [Cervus hanglu yarkandensis]|nr:hypothetical protein G4228_016872 [Cervus hanglu yarkandensis]